MPKKYDWIIVPHLKEIWLGNNCDCHKTVSLYLNKKDLEEMLKELKEGN